MQQSPMAGERRVILLPEIQTLAKPLNRRLPQSWYFPAMWRLNPQDTIRFHAVIFCLKCPLINVSPATTAGKFISKTPISLGIGMRFSKTYKFSQLIIKLIFCSSSSAVTVLRLPHWLNYQD